MLALQNFVLLGLPLAVAASPSPVKRAPSGSFTLYAYGDGIGGAPVFSDGETAYVGKQSSLNGSNVAQVTFTVGDNNSLLASPNTTSGTTTPSWSNTTFYVPSTSSSAHTVGFTNSTPSDEMAATDFIFYGQVVFHQNDDGDLEGEWYATTTQYDEVWTLKWNTSSDDNSTSMVAVTLKATAPTLAMDGSDE
ncbi:hypothetical protein F5Y15DRAFT_52177 [Xylariaceae sp. FL0016]|nr:hypothetical protein F5Y15DRAFT_52177 [Xylariaceae sp. FL0016]